MKQKIKNKKTIIILVVILLAIISAVSVFGVREARSTKSGGEFTNELYGRVSFNLSPTEFTFKNDGSDCILETVLTARKNAMDFYAVLESITVSGLEYEKIVVTPESTNGENGEFAGLVMSSDDDGPITYKWKVAVYFGADAQITTPTIEILYSAGVKQEAASTRVMDIPLEIVFE